MNNNDIFKKLRVALMLRDDQIVEILELVDFRMSKGEIGNIFRNQDHPNFMECGDQLLRNFLNGLVIHLRGTKDDPKNPNDVLAKHRAEIPPKAARFPKDINTKNAATGNPARSKTEHGSAKPDFKKKPASNAKSRDKKPAKIQVVEKVQFKNGKNKKS
jgi:hypothetical protein